MPTLRSENGSVFIIQPYRELFDPEKTSLLKKKIRTLAKNQGENIRLYKQNDGRIEAVFSRESGFLLAETIWAFLDKPQNLIYCESLPERRQALLLVIKNGLVFLDAKMPFGSLIDEFMALSTADEKYDIVVYGDVPLAEIAEGGKYAFQQKNIKSFKVLDEPLLSQITVEESAQLQPLELALASPTFGKPKYIPFVIISAIIIFIVIIWNLLTPTKTPNIQIYKPTAPTSPFASYYQALTTPSPNNIINELAMNTTLAHDLPGWTISSINYDGSNYQIKLITENGRITDAQEWARMNNYNMSLQTDGSIIVNIPSTKPNRPKPTAIYSLQQTLALLLDELSAMVGPNKVQFTTIVSHQNFQETNVAINFTDLNLGMLLLIGQEIDNLPVSINSISVLAQKHLYSGKILLKLLGN